MRLRLLPPSPDRSVDLLAAAADLACQAATALCEVATDPAGATATAATARLLDLTDDSTHLTTTLRRQLGSGSLVITRLDPIDLLTLAVGFHDTVQAMADAAGLFWAHQISLPLPAAAEQAHDLLRAARAATDAIGGLRQRRPDPTRILGCCQAIYRLQRASRRRSGRARAELYMFTGTHPTGYVLQWVDILDRLDHAMGGLASLARTIGTITLARP